MTTYLNPEAIQGYTAAQQGKLLAKGANGIVFVDGGSTETTDFEVREISDPYSDVVDIGSDDYREYLYTSVDIGGNIDFRIYGNKENYILIHSRYEDVRLTIGALDSSSNAIAVIQPSEIVCPADSYIELSIIRINMNNEDYAVVSVSSPLIVIK